MQYAMDETNTIILNVLKSILVILDAIDVELERMYKLLTKILILVSYRKGQKSSACGKAYESVVHSVCRQLYGVDDEPFCTQEKTAGSSAEHDLICEFEGKYIPIEIKKYGTPDWMQMSIAPDEEGLWRSKSSGRLTKHTKSTVELFENIIGSTILYNGKMPPTNITHDEWKSIKAEGNFGDVYLPCPNDTISRLYSATGVYYIQISELGLYHAGVDICKFNVPHFICDSRMRVRIKIHTSSSKSGRAVLSVTCAAQPISLKNILPSPYSLDNINRVPIIFSSSRKDNDFA